MVDNNTVGAYVITYDVTDSGGLAAAQVTRTVNVTVNTAPIIALNGAAIVDLIVGDPFVDPGAVAVDVEDGDISINIVVGGDVVNTNAAGTYVITYDVTDSGGMAATQVTRTVNVVGNNAPVITINGSAVVNILVGSAYNDAGATAQDVEDGDISMDIVVGGSGVNTGTAGVYTVTYNVTDSDGNAATQVTRTVNVNAPTPPPPAPSSGGGASGLIEVIGMAFLVLATRRRRRWLASRL